MSNFDWLFILIAVLLVAGYLAWTLHIRIKAHRCRTQMLQLSRKDPCWYQDLLNEQVEQTHQAVYQAIKERRPEPAREYLTPALYQNFSADIDQLRQDGLRPMIFEQQLQSIQIIDLRMAQGDNPNRIWALIQGRMMDYLVDDTSKELLCGLAETRPYRELWLFCFQGERWQLEAAEQSSSYRTLASTAFSDSEQSRQPEA